jgi:NAD(P)-dependent dehydrogenase (short-subunit alcohol dehydrogenase family)
MKNEMLNLTGKVAVVTGAASGIGKAIANTFAAAEAHVVLIDINAAATQQAADGIGANGGKAFAYACDVSNPESVKQVFAAIEEVAAIDILVNSAGVAHVGNLLNTSVDDFERLFRVNVKGTYLCMQAAVEQMAKRKSGVILNLASIAATAGLSNRFAYSMTKGAVLSMTISVAKDMLDTHIRCNCISPARVHTPFVDGFVKKNYPGREEEMFRELAASQPIGRMGTPEEVASLALYLCSDAASFITGADIPLDGGFFNLR